MLCIIMMDGSDIVDARVDWTVWQMWIDQMDQVGLVVLTNGIYFSYQQQKQQ